MEHVLLISDAVFFEFHQQVQATCFVQVVFAQLNCAAVKRREVSWRSLARDLLLVNLRVVSNTFGSARDQVDRADNGLYNETKMKR